MQDVQAQVLLYAKENGDARTVLSGFATVATPVPKPDSSTSCWSVRMFSDTPVVSGSWHTVTLMFLVPEGQREMTARGSFFLWEGKAIAEVRIENGPNK